MRNDDQEKAMIDQKTLDVELVFASEKPVTVGIYNTDADSPETFVMDNVTVARGYEFTGGGDDVYRVRGMQVGTGNLKRWVLYGDELTVKIHDTHGNLLWEFKGKEVTR